MHFCVYVFVPKEGDIKEEVATSLRLYSMEHEVPPYKEYLKAEETLMMGRHYGIRRGDRKELSSHMEDWNGNPGGCDARGLFCVKTRNPQAKWDYYQIGGRWNRFPGDIIGAEALLRKKNLRDILPAAMVTPDRLWHERETIIMEEWMQWSTKRKPLGRWVREVTKALRMHPHSRIVCVDIHR